MNVIHKIRELIIISITVSVSTVFAQDSLTIDQCQSMALNNYPLIKSSQLITELTRFNAGNITSGYYPSVSVYSQFSIQSDVTKLPVTLPNIDIPQIEKEQYKVFAEINQILFDGGLISSQRKIAEANGRIEQENIQIELHKVKERISQIYFGILIVDEQIEQVNLLLEDLESGLQKLETGYRNGTVLKSNIDILEVELLKAGQQLDILEGSKSALYNALGLLIGKKIDHSTFFHRPQIFTKSEDLDRPEIKYFDAKLTALDLQHKSLNAKNLPKLNLFVNAGYGSPALNMLDPDADTYYIAGMKFIWPLSGFYNFSREKSILKLNSQSVKIQKETFLLNTNIQISQQQTEIEKYKQLLISDEKIVPLREEIARVALTQLENGLVTSTDYVREVNAANYARQSKSLHEIQLSMAYYNYNLITGNN